MHTDIYIVHARSLCQVLLEILHMRDKELLLAGEVFVDLSVFVKHMYDNDLLRGERVGPDASIVLLETVMNAAAAATAPCTSLAVHLVAVRTTAATTYTHY